MARLITTGFEQNDMPWPDGGYDSKPSGLGTQSSSTSTKRSGARSLKLDSLSGLTAYCWYNMLTLSTAVSYYGRLYINIESMPSAALTRIAYWGSSGTIVFSAYLTSGGLLELWRGNNPSDFKVGSSSAVTLTTGVWYRIELRIKIGTGATDEGELLLDGTQVAVTTTANQVDTAPTDFVWGWTSGPGANKVCYVDDVAINNDSGGNQNSFPGAGSVVNLFPVSDNARNGWTAGAGGTTNLFEAVNNIPPGGVASGSETNTTNIESATNSATDNCDLNLTSYSNAGIGGGDTIKVIQVYCAHGEDITTTSKSGSIELTSNPVIASTSFTYGDDLGAHAIWSTTWGALIWYGTTYNPSVTMGTEPVIRVGKRTSTTRTVCVCSLGAVVEYDPGVAAPIPSLTMAPRIAQGVF